MASSSTGLGNENLPQLDAIDQLNFLWKQTSGPLTTSTTGPASAAGIQQPDQAACTSHNSMAGMGTADIDLEATPDLELKVVVNYLNRVAEKKEASLNPTRTVQQLKARLAPLLRLQAGLIEMSWSKKLNDGQQAPPIVLQNEHNLLFYEVETDDTIIIQELAEGPGKRLDCSNGGPSDNV
ncbi:hypothetical protein PoB_002004500 [Plakobranchus ocellatus]|uniref:Ubiquitin-like domain-containing protein n=1 Tax=Plakobranchus ocellatus TaxID=259542 RepID=A0AAV3ZEG1_9GAST|nr:hypothetical protein PoB_002004500 [Plakobranchus ocellatus]